MMNTKGRKKRKRGDSTNSCPFCGKAVLAALRHIQVFFLDCCLLHAKMVQAGRVTPNRVVKYKGPPGVLVHCTRYNVRAGRGIVHEVTFIWNTESTILSRENVVARPVLLQKRNRDWSPTARGAGRLSLRTASMSWWKRSTGER